MDDFWGLHKKVVSGLCASGGRHPQTTHYYNNF